MPFYFLIAVLPTIAAFASGSIAVYAWQRREINGARAFALCTTSIFVWCFFSVFEYLSLEETARITFGRAQYLGIVSFPVFWLVFTLRYAQCDGWLSQRVLGGLSAIPLVSLGLALSDPWHGWIWHEVSVELSPFPQLVIDHGWWFNYVLIPHCYVLLIAGFGVLLSASFTGSRLYRQQTLVLSTAAIAPFVFNVLYVVSGITFYGLDLTPVGFAIGGVLIHLGLFRVKFLEIAPVSYKTVFLNTADAVILLDIHYRIVDLNPSALTHRPIPFEMETAMGKAFEQIFPEYGELLRKLGHAQQLTQTIKIPQQFVQQHHQPGEEVFREVKVRSLLSPGGSRVGWVIIIRDATLEKQKQAQLERFAYVDSLTGLFNRRQLEMRAKEIFSGRSRRINDLTPLNELDDRYDSRKKTLPTALLYIDLNRFKPINDRYGHAVGDAVLQHFAQCLKRSVRQGDIVARLGGDEFAALLHGADLAVASEVRSRLTKTLNQETVLGGHRLTISASIGIAYYPRDGGTLQDLLHRADNKMYQEKRLTRER